MWAKDRGPDTVEGRAYWAGYDAGRLTQLETLIQRLEVYAAKQHVPEATQALKALADAFRYEARLERDLIHERHKVYEKPDSRHEG